jgi:calcineurin-like phosphoesterase family protein
LLKIEDGSNVFFTSDLHFNHKNILKFQKNRQFETIEDMNETLISNWNSVINEDSIVFNLGDVSFGTKLKTENILKRLNGKIHLISGNHDFLKNARFEPYFESIRRYREISIEDQRIVLFHFPIYDWNNTSAGWWHLHGHTHNTYFGKGKIIDVGIDTNKELKPYTFKQIKDIMATKEIKYHYENENKDIK